MADAFGDLLAVDNSLIRKFGRVLVAVQDYSEPVPDSFYDENGLPVLPETAKQLGFITTDGVTQGKAVSATDTTMLQWVDPVRSDLESVVKTLACSFGEATNAWVRAVYEGKQVSDFPASAKAPWSFDDGEFVDFPYYRLWLLAADGVGDQAFYRVEYHPYAKVTSTTDRTLARANPETIGFTFGIFKDPATGTAQITNENGPGFGIEPVEDPEP